MSKSKVEYEESWLCDTCNDKVSMSRGQALYHLQEIHKIKPPFSGTKTAIEHMDVKDWFTWILQWKIGDVKLTQAVTEPR